MNAKQAERFLETNGIRQITRMPGTGDWRVCLTCGGPSGFGGTVDAALRHARYLNSEWLEQAA